MNINIDETKSFLESLKKKKSDKAESKILKDIAEPNADKNENPPSDINNVEQEVKSKELPVVNEATKLTVVKDESETFVASELPNEVEELIAKQRKRDIDLISQTDTFKQASAAVTDKKIKNELTKEGLEALNGEYQNEAQAYMLAKFKQSLDYKKKKEKPLIAAEAKADINKQKYAIAEKRYGYLYYIAATKINAAGEREPIFDEFGQPVYVIDKDKFTPNKFTNIFREITHNYERLSDDTKIIIKKTLRVSFWLFICSAIILGLVFGSKALISSGVLNI